MAMEQVEERGRGGKGGPKGEGKDGKDGKDGKGGARKRGFARRKVCASAPTATCRSITRTRRP